MRRFRPGRPYSEMRSDFRPCATLPALRGDGAYPADFREGRVIRAYDREQNMIAGEIVNGREPETVIEKLFENPETEFIQVRSADRGCYTFRIERA